MGILSTFLLINFSRSRVDVNRVIPLIIADIRTQQSRGSSSNINGGTLRCGFGIHYNSNSAYDLYAGPKVTAPSPNDCTSSRNYNLLQNDILLETKTISQYQVEIKQSFSDIFFEPPDPKTYINNSAALNGAPAKIIIGPSSVASCVANTLCATICVYPSGKIETYRADGALCPAS